MRLPLLPKILVQLHTVAVLWILFCVIMGGHRERHGFDTALVLMDYPVFRLAALLPGTVLNLYDAEITSHTSHDVMMFATALVPGTLEWAGIGWLIQRISEPVRRWEPIRTLARGIPGLSLLLAGLHASLALVIFLSVAAGAGGYQNGLQWGVMAWVDVPVLTPLAWLPEGQSPWNPALMSDMKLNGLMLAYTLAFGTLWWVGVGWIIQRLYENQRKSGPPPGDTR